MPALDADTIARFNKLGLIGLLDVEILSAGNGAAHARLEVQPHHLAPNGFLHAATIIALADSCCGYGTYADLPEGAEMFTTAELKSNHMGTARSGEILCEAKAVHQGKTTQVWDASVRTVDSPDKPIALFRCTQIILWPKPATS